MPVQEAIVLWRQTDHRHRRRRGFSSRINSPSRAVLPTACDRRTIIPVTIVSTHTTAEWWSAVGIAASMTCGVMGTLLGEIGATVVLVNWIVTGLPNGPVLLCSQASVDLSSVVCRLSSSVMLPAGGRAGRRAHGRSAATRPGAWAVGRPTLHGGPVGYVRATPCFISKWQIKEKTAATAKNELYKCDVAFLIITTMTAFYWDTAYRWMKQVVKGFRR